MAARTIENLRGDIQRNLHGTDVSKVTGEFGLYNEGARAVLNDIDFFETKQTAQIANAIYTNVFDYALPTDLKGNKIIDIRPQVKRNLGDLPRQTYNMNFDRRKMLQDFTIMDNNRVRTLRFNADVGVPTVLHTMDSITENGTWSVGDDATNLTVDTLNFITNASLNFDTTGSGTTASLENDDLAEINLETWEDQAAFFVCIYIPVVITNTTLTWGDNASVNWSDTVTTPQNGSFVVGWNLVRFDWNGATETGSPDASAIAYLKIAITYDGNADTDYRVDNIVSNLGEIYEIDYYSKFLFQNTSGTNLEEVSAATDTINLELEGYNCLLYKVMELAAPQIQAEDAAFDLQLYQNEYQKNRRRYQAKYKSEIRIPTQKYYRSTVRSNRGRRRVIRSQNDETLSIT